MRRFRARRAELDGVADQIAQHLTQQLLVRDHPTVAVVHRQANLLALGGQAVLLDDFDDQVVDFQRLRASASSRCESIASRKTCDHFDHAVEGHVHVVEDAAGFVVVAQDVAQHELRHADVGQRALEIVRDDAGEVLLHLLGEFQLGERLACARPRRA